MKRLKTIATVYRGIVHRRDGRDVLQGSFGQKNQRSLHRPDPQVLPLAAAIPGNSTEHFDKIHSTQQLPDLNFLRLPALVTFLSDFVFLTSAPHYGNRRIDARRCKADLLTARIHSGEHGPSNFYDSPAQFTYCTPSSATRALTTAEPQCAGSSPCVRRAHRGSSPLRHLYAQTLWREGFGNSTEFIVPRRRGSSAPLALGGAIFPTRSTFPHQLASTARLIASTRCVAALYSPLAVLALLTSFRASPVGLVCRGQAVTFPWRMLPDSSASDSSAQVPEPRRAHRLSLHSHAQSCLPWRS